MSKDYPIVTLTTDWGSKDFFAGMVKGKLLSDIPNVRIVDISHEIDHFNRVQAAFVVRHGCMGFPQGTIHIIDVATVQSESARRVAIQCKGQYFICPDNGIPHAVFGDEPFSAVALEAKINGPSATFTAYQVFCDVAARLASGASLSSLGPAVDSLASSTPMNYFVSENRLVLYVAYVDDYGNTYLNITYDEFQRICNGRQFSLNIRNNFSERITRFTTSYSIDPLAPSKLMLTVSSTGLLEIAMLCESAEQMLNLGELRKVEVIFK